MAKYFPGGLHPPDYEELSCHSPLVDAPLPERLYIVATQNLGAPTKIIVKKRATVLRGEVLAQPGGFVSSPVHAPTSGTIAAIGPHPHPAMGMAQTITLDPDGEDRWCEDIPAPLQSREPNEMLDAIARAGIVGLGGATFPTHVKLAPPADKPVDLLLINGAECEPYITSDRKLMETHPDEIIRGTQLLMTILGVEKCIIGIEDNKPNAAKMLRQASADDKRIEVLEFPVMYPQGGEKQLICAVTGREVPPPPGLPSDVGVVVQNVSTVFAVKQAIMDGIPLIERIVTVTGNGVINPGNFRVRIGVPYKALIDAAGGFSTPPERVINGGPMMGQTVFDLDTPVTKGTSCILVLTPSEAAQVKSAPCIRCGRCVTVCPMGLVPNMMATAAERESWEIGSDYGAMDCMECGCCTYTCPAGRPIVQLVRTAKYMLRKAEAKKKNG
jgi:H+/Na+-translocating ferredoxin:NAD+ oxidoreductase subunit C